MEGLMDIASYQGTEITQLQISQPLNIEHSTKPKKVLRSVKTI